MKVPIKSNNEYHTLIEECFSIAVLVAMRVPGSLPEP